MSDRGPLPQDLSKALSIVLVTSPIRANPATDLIDAVISSLDILSDLNGCELIVVADGARAKETRPEGAPVVPNAPTLFQAYKPTEEDGDEEESTDTTAEVAGRERVNTEGTEASQPSDGSPSRALTVREKRRANANNWRQGIVAKDSWKNYEEYVRRLRAKYDTTLAGVEGKKRPCRVIGPLPFHGGFSYALLEGLKLVNTPLVLTKQHDRIFCDTFDFRGCCGLMLASDTASAGQFSHINDQINYIGFPSNSTVGYLNNRCLAKGAFREVAKSLLKEEQVGYEIEAYKKSKETKTCGDEEGQGGFGEDRKSDDEAEGPDSAGKFSASAAMPIDEAHARSANDPAFLAQHLTPLFLRYDSAHICRTGAYVDVVSNKCKPNQFIESTLSPQLWEDVANRYKEGIQERCGGDVNYMKSEKMKLNTDVTIRRARRHSGGDFDGTADSARKIQEDMGKERERQRRSSVERGKEKREKEAATAKEDQEPSAPVEAPKKTEVHRLLDAYEAGEEDDGEDESPVDGKPKTKTVASDIAPVMPPLPYVFEDHLQNVGVFLYKTDLECVRHLDGRGFWNDLQRQQMGFHEKKDVSLMRNIMARTESGKAESKEAE